ncbi:telomere length regulation protein [Entomortierella parvispora]|uniref:Telomere length regulation protein n=1 Tax=Entomortierella parvispora TaxID=205924 RepID=A0A9P3H394_9FUNG|nr:telomere length regulation protein [Entomortierella parvispora]
MQSSSIQSEAISVHLTDLQSLVLVPAPTLTDITLVLAEPLSFLGLVVEDPSSDIAPWTGAVESTPARRQYFVQRLLGSHLDFILDHITVDWLSALPSTLQTVLFDSYFVPSESHKIVETGMALGSKPFNTSVAMVSLHTLVGRLNSRFHENHTFLNETILRLLQRILKSFTLGDFYRASSVSGHLDVVHGRDLNKADVVSYWNLFISKLLSIPTAVSNAFGISREHFQDISPCFQESVFFEEQSIQLIQCLEESATGSSHETAVYRKILAETIGKLMRMGYGRILVEAIFSKIWNTTSKAQAPGWKGTLELVPSGVTRSFLSAVVEYLQRSKLADAHSPLDTDEDRLFAVHQSANVLVSLGFAVDDRNNSSIEDILFQGRVFNIDVLRVLICVQSGWPSNRPVHGDSVLARTFVKTLTVWSDPMFVKRSSAEYQRYISYQLLLILGYLDGALIKGLDATALLHAGMAKWLDLEDFKRKTIGLIVAEEFSKRVDSPGAAADFGLPGSNPDVIIARSLVNFRDGQRPFQPTGKGAGKSTVISTAEPELEPEPLQESDEEDPDAIVDSYSSRNLKTGGLNSADDSDSDLQPYDMEGDSDTDEDMDTVKKPKVAVPLFLRDLLAYIRASEDRKKAEVGLSVAAELIRRKGNSLEIEEFAESLARALIQLQDTFEMDNFYKKKEEALVALVVSAPKVVAGVLTDEFYKKTNSIGQRLNILTAISLAARELSGFDRLSIPDTLDNQRTLALQSAASTKSNGGRTPRPSSMPANRDSSEQSPATFGSITSSISLARTRRFSQKSDIEARRPTPKANPFASLAPVFLGGLLGRWGGNRGAGNERGYDAMQRAPAMVLKKFIMSLGIIVYYSGNSPHLLSMTRELLRFLLSLRYHSPPEAAPMPLSFSANANSRLKSSLSTEETLAAMMTASSIASTTTPTLTTLKMPGDHSSKTGSFSSAGASVPYNAELAESLLFGLLILLTPPSTETLPDALLLSEFFPEIMECYQWALEVWEILKAEHNGGSAGGEKAKMYCASILQRCVELLKM